MLKDLFRRKTMDQLVAEAEQPEHRLKKALGPVDVTALGIGAIIGAGIFATIGLHMFSVFRSYLMFWRSQSWRLSPLFS